MITRLSIRNYQSLHVVDLDLKPFTVIVGPSSSGKSALTRALRTLAFNARGSSFVSTWANRAVIEADLADSSPNGLIPRGTVTLTRGAKTDDNAYVITPPPGINEDAPESRYTKLGGETPYEVSQFLRLFPEDDSLHFAAQFDKPYLLDDAPAAVARSFAALTNVHVVFAAARESRRTRLNVSQTLKTREADLSAITARKPEFVALKARAAAQAVAEERLAAARDLEAQKKNLVSAIDILTAADDVLARTAPLLATPVPSLEKAEALRAQRDVFAAAVSAIDASSQTLSRTSEILAAPIPSLETAQRLADERREFLAAVVAVRDTGRTKNAAGERLVDADSALTNAQASYEIALAEIGTCPTCGQSTTHLGGWRG